MSCGKPGFLLQLCPSSKRDLAILYSLLHRIHVGIISYTLNPFAVHEMYVDVLPVKDVRIAFSRRSRCKQAFLESEAFTRVNAIVAFIPVH